MIEVEQDIFLNDPQGRLGNCMQACIASICEKPLHEVPHFVELPDDEWFPAMCDWLLDRGWRFEDHDSVKDSSEYMLVVGPSMRGSSHAVVYKDGVIVHDPHPSKAGILEVKWCMSIFNG